MPGACSAGGKKLHRPGGCARAGWDVQLKQVPAIARGPIFLHLAAAALISGLGTPATGQVALPAETHPSLLFSASDLPVLRERIRRAPYSGWWQTVLRRAENVPSSFPTQRSKARYAKSLAFAYLMTDRTAFAERSVEIMLDMKFPPRGGDLGEPHNEGEVVAHYALAYDMLDGFLAADPVSRAGIREILAEEAERLDEGIVIREIDLGFLGSIRIRLHETPDPRNTAVIHLNNWHIRPYAALGLAAFVLADHPGRGGRSPENWAGRAFDLVTRSLDHQIDGTDGGYAEGPFYARYAADLYLPYMFALKRLAETDLFVDPKVDLMHDWSLNLRLPNGRRPNIDDSHLDDFYGHYLASVDANGPVHLWDWENNSFVQYVREFSEMDAIVLYDDGIDAREPEYGPTIFMPEAGDAVFRSDWSEDATYMLLRGEHGRAREQGLGHEHADETSFLIYAAGEMLAVDGGYIDFSNHHKVNAGPSHSLILVDGRGPPLDTLLGQAVDGGNDAWIQRYFTGDSLDYAEVAAAYEGVGIRRRVMFVGKRYFVVSDRVRDESSHLYEWRLHGNGGGTSGGTYRRTGSLARWTRSQAELLAFMPAAEERTFSEAEAIHSFAYREEPTHTLLRVRETGDDVDFLAVLFPRALTDAEPVIAAPPATGGEAVSVEKSGTTDYAWSSIEGQTTGVATEFGRLTSDAGFGLVSFGAGALSEVTLIGATLLSIDGVQVFSASNETDLSLVYAAGRASGFLREGSGGTVAVIALSDPAAAAEFPGELEASSYSDGALTLRFSGAGPLAVTTADAASVPTPFPPPPETLAADFDDSGKVDFADFFLFADAFGHPARGERTVYDLDGNGEVDFRDFFLFADQFNRSAGD